MELVIAETAPTAGERAAQFVLELAASVLERRGRFDVAVSGGSTPEAMFAVLARAGLPWDAVHVYQVDERVAPDGDPARNAAQLGVLPLPVGNLHLMPVTAGDLPAAAAAYAAELPERFDLVHLGLGDDGHTASWPPGDPVVASEELVAVVGPFNGHVRMTLTPLVVNAAERRLVLVTGAGKADVVARWWRGDPALPASHLSRDGTTLVTDRGASVGLDAPDHPDPPVAGP